MSHPQAADRLVDTLTGAADDTLVAVLGFGSRVSGASPDERSAWDLFLVVRDYQEFYPKMAAALGWRTSPRRLARLNSWLPPNVTHLEEADGPGAKFFIISESDLARRLSPGALDHFCRARLMQPVAMLHLHDDDARRRIGTQLGTARRSIVAWLRPFLREPFTVEEFCRRLLHVSYRTEVRPESGDRSAEVFAVQRDALMELYTPILEEAAEAGVLTRNGPGYAVAHPAGWAARRAAGLRLWVSKVLATLRWPKYLLTFEGWLDYIVAKVERRVGVEIHLTERERRWPLLFLWPKFFRVMRARNEATGDAGR